MILHTPPSPCTRFAGSTQRSLMSTIPHILGRIVSHPRELNGGGSMKLSFLATVGVGLLACSMSAMAADQTFNGEIMDSACAKAGNHDAMINSGKMKDAKSCTTGCVKGGAKYVLYN